MFEAVEALGAQYEAMKAKLGSEGRAAVKAMFQGFFATYPGVSAVRWTQYTPHFNDGDPCRFSVHDADILFVNDARWHTSWDLEGRTDSLEGDFAKLSDLLQTSTLEFVLREAFGDGYEVTATREAITAEHYDHD